MWFKSIQAFSLTRSRFFSQIDLEAYLKPFTFSECTSNQLSSFGWISALPNTEQLCHSVNNKDYTLLRYQKETKLLPAAHIKREVAKKVAVMELEFSRYVTKKEKEQIKEDLIFELLPQAFSSQKVVSVYIDNVNELVVVDSASRGEAEDILALLRKCLGTLPVTSFFSGHDIQECVNDWLTGDRDIPEAINIGENVKLSGMGDMKPMATFCNEDVFDNRITSLIREDERDIDYLQLSFDGCFSMQLNTDGIIKKLKAFDVLQEQNEDIDSDDVIARLDADFVLMTGELTRLFCEFMSMGVVEKIEKEPFDIETLSKPSVIDKELAEDAA